MIPNGLHSPPMLSPPWNGSEREEQLAHCKMLCLVPCTSSSYATSPLSPKLNLQELGAYLFLPSWQVPIHGAPSQDRLASVLHYSSLNNNNNHNKHLSLSFEIDFWLLCECAHFLIQYSINMKRLFLIIDFE